MKIVIPEDMALNQDHLNIMRSLGEFKAYDNFPETEEEIIKRVENADIIVIEWLFITKKVIDNAKNLKYIIVALSGTETVDVEHAAKKGIKVLNCPTYNSEGCANLTIGFILNLTRKIKEANTVLQLGDWVPPTFTGIELRGKVLGLIGYGNIGRKVGNIARLLGMNVKYVNSQSTPEQLEDLIKTSDIISLHVPLTNETSNIMNKRRIDMMKKGSYLINVSRGDLVDQKALIEALKTKHLAGAGLDVFENEPFRKKKAKVPEEIMVLSKMDNVIATPHIAYNTEERITRLGLELIENIQSCIDNSPINLVTDKVKIKEI